MLGCDSPASTSRSRVNRARNGPDNNSACGSFSATSRTGPSSPRAARHTRPMPPSPNGASSRYGPMTSPSAKSAGNASGKSGFSRKSLVVTPAALPNTRASHGRNGSSSPRNECNQGSRSASVKSMAWSSSVENRLQCCGGQGKSVMRNFPVYPVRRNPAPEPDMRRAWWPGARPGGFAPWTPTRECLPGPALF